jgi:hypothetical protein
LVFFPIPHQNFAWEWQHCEIYQARMPDILHELSRGVFLDLKEATFAVLNAFGARPASQGREKTRAITTLDERMKAMPHYHGCKKWSNGISELTGLTGREEKLMMQVGNGGPHSGDPQASF